MSTLYSKSQLYPRVLVLDDNIWRLNSLFTSLSFSATFNSLGHDRSMGECSVDELHVALVEASGDVLVEEEMVEELTED